MLSAGDYLVVLISLSGFLIPAVASGAENHPVDTVFFEPGIVLPAGEGQSVIFRACTVCHDLAGLPAYKGYWNYERWMFLVETMVKHGAELNEQEKILAARYLAEHFGVD